MSASKHIITVILLLVCSIAYPHDRKFRNVSVSDGLSDLLVSVIHKDSLGYVWIGTGVGLDRFDGVCVKSCSGPDYQGGRIYALAESSEGDIFAGASDGLYVFDKNFEALLPIAEDHISGMVSSLLHDGDSRLFVGTRDGLYICDSCTSDLHRVWIDKNSLSTANSICDMTLSEDGVLWLATEAGLYSLKLSDRSVSAYHDNAGSSRPFHFIAIEKIGDELFLGTRDCGIVRFDIQEGKFEEYMDVGCNVISSLSSYGNTLYVGTDGNGLHLIDISRDVIVGSFRHDAGPGSLLPSNSVYSVYAGEGGMFWIGYYQHGMSYTLYQNDLFDVYSSSLIDTYGMSVRSVSIQGSQKLIGSREGFMFIDESRNIVKRFRTPQLRADIVLSVLFHEGLYHIGTYGGGMYVFDPASLSVRDFDSSGEMPFSKGQISSIKEDREGNMWVATSHGAYRYRNGSCTAVYNISNSKIPSNQVNEIFFDSSGKGWICTEGGLCIWDPSTDAIYSDRFPSGFRHKESMRVVFEDSEHMLYFCPDKGDIFRTDLHMTEYGSMTPSQSTQMKEVRFITEDIYGWLVIGTNDGLFRYDKNNTLIPYGFIDGIPSGIFAFCPPFHDGDTMWIANDSGLLCLDQTRLDLSHAELYPLHVTDVKEHGTSSVTFAFSDFTYTSSSSMVYEYMLQGRDAGWQVLKGSSEVTFYDLDPGNYIFKVRKMGVPESEVLYEIKITSSSLIWWICIGFALAVMIVFLFSRSRYYRRMAMSVVPVVEPHPSDQEEKYRTNRIDAEECRRIAVMLEKYMDEAKPYINKDLKIADLASAVKTSSHSLSYVLNQYLNTNFYDYINEFRIKEFCRLVNTDAYSKYTLTALSELCGFSSRASFFRSFKKAKGVTPSEFVHNKRII